MTHAHLPAVVTHAELKLAQQIRHCKLLLALLTGWTFIGHGGCYSAECKVHYQGESTQQHTQSIAAKYIVHECTCT